LDIKVAAKVKVKNLLNFALALTFLKSGHGIFDSFRNLGQDAGFVR
jgi:hypothetical protein